MPWVQPWVYGFNKDTRTLRFGFTDVDWWPIGRIDQIFIGTSLGKSVVLGEVTNTEMVNNLTTVTVKEADGLTWTDDFIEELAANKQKIYVTVLNNKPILNIDLIVDRAVEPTKPLVNNPEHFTGKLDANDDGKITDVEAAKFATSWIREGGSSFKQLANGIPPTLPVKLVSVNFPPNEISQFNGVTAEVIINRGKSTLYIEVTVRGFPGVRTDKYGDIDAPELSEVLWDVKRSVQRKFPDALVEKWPVPFYTLSVFDKGERNTVVSDEQIESLKKVKKGNKYYHKIEFVDSELLSPQRPPGKYNNCLVSIIKNDPPAF